jgi:hypothetical protein
VVHRIRPRRCSASNSRGSTSRWRAGGTLCPGPRHHRDGETCTTVLCHLLDLPPSNYRATPAIDRLVDDDYRRALALFIHANKPLLPPPAAAPAAAAAAAAAHPATSPSAAAASPSEKPLRQKRDARPADFGPPPGGASRQALVRYRRELIILKRQSTSCGW